MLSLADELYVRNTYPSFVEEVNAYIKGIAELALYEYNKHALFQPSSEKILQIKETIYDQIYELLMGEIIALPNQIPIWKILVELDDVLQPFFISQFLFELEIYDLQNHDLSP
jgi:hypothetical protein